MPRSYGVCTVPTFDAPAAMATILIARPPPLGQSLEAL